MNVEDKVDQIVPIIFAEVSDDDKNETNELFLYYQECNTAEKTVVNNIMIYLCEWSFETILEKCGIRVDENGNPVIE
jgi:hypothetical protein